MYENGETVIRPTGEDGSVTSTAHSLVLQKNRRSYGTETVRA
jgi:hypothetical protein